MNKDNMTTLFIYFVETTTVRKSFIVAEDAAEKWAIVAKFNCQGGGRGGGGGVVHLGFIPL